MIEPALLLMATLAATTAGPATTEPEVIASPSAAPEQAPDDESSPPAPPAGAPAPPAPTAPAATPEAPTRRRRLLVMPYFGVQTISPVHDRITADAGNFGGGYRFGGKVGWRINQFLSLNAEVTLDFDNESPAPEGYRGSLREWLFSFCPLVHLGQDAVQIVAGPKVGLLFGSESSGNGSGGGPHADWSGASYGAELGLFVRLLPALSVGGVAAIDVMRPSAGRCDGNPDCPIASYPPGHNVKSGTLALLF